MKKESAQVVQEIYQTYGLDNYVKDEFTQSIFKEFRKYGTKLAKIANCEDMQKKGVVLQSELVDLLSKKEQFKSHLDTLKHALDLYAASLKSLPAKPSSPPVAAESNATPIKVDTESELRRQRQIQAEESALLIGSLLTIGRLAEAEENGSVAPAPLRDGGINADIARSVYKQLVAFGAETSIRDEVQRQAEILRRLIVRDGSTPAGEELAAMLEKVRNTGSIAEARFRPVEKKADATEPRTEAKKTSAPPGLLPPAAETEKKAKAETATVEDAGVPPDPSRALPVSVLVSSGSVEENDRPAPTATKQEPTMAQREREGYYYYAGQQKEEEDFAFVTDKNEARKQRLAESQGPRGRYGRGRFYGGGRRRGRFSGYRRPNY